MKFRLLISIVFLATLVGCSSSSTPNHTQQTNTQLPTAFLSPTLAFIPTNTLTPFPTSTPSLTPIASITPQAGYQIWDLVSKPGVYTIQYPKDEWMRESDRLTHRTLKHCFIAEFGGNDMCMSGGCPDTTEITFGDVTFSKMAFGNNNHAIYTSGSRFALSFEAYSLDNSHCIEEAEKVLSTLQIRPERGCIDRAAFVTDVTISDNTVIPAGSKFTKTWRLKNVGTCTWTKQYSLEVHGKSSGTEADWIYLHHNVEPQQTIDLSIELPAPLVEGVARWEAVLKNDFGDLFGLGSEPYTDMFGKPFWVQIIVAPVSTP
ncbi:MAG TPA: NBR1-Ig-like domain-containing protein [Anaerolineales bacterium]|nr:NBR1-Ig-like domain-containing protein [Anaerolineales bacterium]